MTEDQVRKMGENPQLAQKVLKEVGESRSYGSVLTNHVIKLSTLCKITDVGGSRDLAHGGQFDGRSGHLTRDVFTISTVCSMDCMDHTDRIPPSPTPPRKNPYLAHTTSPQVRKNPYLAHTTSLQLPRLGDSSAKARLLTPLVRRDRSRSPGGDSSRSGSPGERSRTPRSRSPFDKTGPSVGSVQPLARGRSRSPAGEKSRSRSPESAGPPTQPAEKLPAVAGVSTRAQDERRRQTAVFKKSVEAEAEKKKALNVASGSVGDLLAHLIRQYRNVPRAWRFAFDLDESGNVSFPEFCIAARDRANYKVGGSCRSCYVKILYSYNTRTCSSSWQ